MKQSYKVLVSFKWRGRWTEKDEVLSLLPVEAQQLLRSKKIEAVPEVVATKSTAKTAATKGD